MQNQAIYIVSQAIRYIEDNLHNNLDLDIVSGALHYSKYYLCRIFTKTAGLTIHNYIKRRQLTEAAKLLVFSKKTVIEIAIISGYKSQQAFTDIFKAMYKTSPAEFRKTGKFYPLQLEIQLKNPPSNMDLKKDDIVFATYADVEDWMELASQAADGYPGLAQAAYINKLHQYINLERALILRNGDITSGIMGFSAGTGNIDFLAVHPQYRHLGIEKLFIKKLLDGLLYNREITLTTFRAGDKADTGYREKYCQLGFEERELLVEYGYPVQRFVFNPEKGGI